MRLFSFCLTACVLSLALMLMHGAAEPLFFPQTERLTWDQARDQCQVCFKELATVTANSTHSIAKNLTSDSWIGLRKNFNSTGNSTKLAWSRWANGDPLAFQNWYPGWPVFQAPLPQINCCSCSCTCPAVTTPLTTSFPSYTTQNFTILNMTNSTLWTSSPNQSTTAAPSLPVHAACVQTPMVIPDLPDPNKNYIADSCVAMLSIGAWVEKNCTELLPFICYEDRFFGQLIVTNISASNAILSWLPGPANISHYRLEVPGIHLTENVGLTFTYNLHGLTAGTSYMVKVTAVKCGRDIEDPQVANFYTIPNKIENLKVATQSETSITLNWDRPVGSADFYLIKYNSQSVRLYAEETEVSNLIQGTLYTFTILVGVNDTSRWSDASTISAYTKPGKVSKLLVSDNTDTTLNLTWSPPNGNFDLYILTVSTKNNRWLNVSRSATSYKVENLTASTRVNLSVTAQVNNSLEGDTVTVVGYTAPEQVKNLVLKTTNSTLTATWARSSEDNYPSFLVELRLGGQLTVTERNETKETLTFDNLKSAALYYVTVYSISGILKSLGVTNSTYTLPVPPTNPNAINWTTNQITFNWTSPLNTANITYSVKLNSSFWGQIKSDIVMNRNNYTFSDLTSGTKYQFEVRTVAGDLQSEPVIMYQTTVEKKKLISFSMTCTSKQSLLCASNTSSEEIFKKLNERFNGVLGDNVYWKLEKRDSEN